MVEWSFLVDTTMGTVKEAFDDPSEDVATLMDGPGVEKYLS